MRLSLRAKVFYQDLGWISWEETIVVSDGSDTIPETLQSMAIDCVLLQHGKAKYIDKVSAVVVE